MRAQVTDVLDEVRSSYWFIPTLMSLGAVALSILMLYLDMEYADRIPSDAWWLFGGGPQAAREVLSAVVTSMISVASVVFSITIVALALAAGQFGSRILRSFMRDRGNQITLGTFIATFVYALLILRTVRGPDEDDFVPPLAMSVGVLLTFVSVGVLIFFIHHIARSIQADNVVDSISRDTHRVLDRIYPGGTGRVSPPNVDDPQSLLPRDFDEKAQRVRAPREGYLQVVDGEKVMKIAQEYDLVIRLRVRPGEFVFEGHVLAEVRCRRSAAPDRIPVDDALDAFREAFIFGPTRTPNQDVEFGILQLVEVAVRSLSTGINDPFTAMTCVDRISALLRRLAERTLPEAARFDKDGQLRVVARSTSFASITDIAFRQIRQQASGSPEVLTRMLEGIEIISEKATTQEQRHALQHQAKLILDSGLQGVPVEADQVDLRKRYAEATRALIPSPSRFDGREGPVVTNE